MTSVLRIAHLRIAHQGAILRWAILRVIHEIDNVDRKPWTFAVDEETTVKLNPTQLRALHHL